MRKPLKVLMVLAIAVIAVTAVVVLVQKNGLNALQVSTGISEQEGGKVAIGRPQFTSTGGSGGGGSPTIVAAESASAASIGFSTGGAKDISNFRENIAAGYLPLPTDITYEGLFYDYYFDTGETQPCAELFCPSYHTAISADPLSQKPEYYLSVGLNSGIREEDFQRKKLNLVVVLDISGSMNEQFDRYYYDGSGSVIDQGEEAARSKIEVARESLIALMDHLKPEDRFGVVLFNDQAYLARELRPLREAGLESIKQHVRELQARGGTHLSAGMKQATELLSSIPAAQGYESRIIFLTDAMPNIGLLDEDDILKITERNAERGIFTTFIGIGVDFNSELVDAVTKTNGANYYAVHSPTEFKKRMSDEFDFMVTPLVFDLTLTLDAKGYEIEKVFGSPEASEATGELMKVATLFPSATNDEGTRGGLVLLKLRKLSDDGRLTLRVQYHDRDGNRKGSEAQVTFPQGASGHFASSGIRKGILLSRYASLLRSWMLDERAGGEERERPRTARERGIAIPSEDDLTLGRWERQSLPLRVSPHYQVLFKEFRKHFEQETRAIGDGTLEKEMVVMEKLVAAR